MFCTFRFVLIPEIMNLKRTSILTAFSLFFLLSLTPFLIKAQEKKNEITISGIAAHYDELQVYHGAKYIYGYYHYPVDPGIELLYSRKLSFDAYLGTGVNFQTGKIASYVNSRRRFQFMELSVPVILTMCPQINNRSGLLFIFGVYWGKLIWVRAEDEGKSENWPEVPMSAVGYYSDNIFFSDLYFSTGYFHSFPEVGKLSLTPFIKYRTNTTWLNYYEKKFHYGIKLSYTIGM
jgi:hypothetical protein